MGAKRRSIQTYMDQCYSDLEHHYLEPSWRLCVTGKGLSLQEPSGFQSSLKEQKGVQGQISLKHYSASSESYGIGSEGFVLFVCKPALWILHTLVWFLVHLHFRESLQTSVNFNSLCVKGG